MHRAGVRHMRGLIDSIVSQRHGRQALGLQALVAVLGLVLFNPVLGLAQSHVGLSFGMVNAYQENGWLVRANLEPVGISTGDLHLRFGAEVWGGRAAVKTFPRAHRNLVGFGPSVTARWGRGAFRPYGRVTGQWMSSNLENAFFIWGSRPPGNYSGLGLTDGKGWAMGGELGATVRLKNRIRFNLGGAFLWPDIYDSGNGMIARYMLGLSL